MRIFNKMKVPEVLLWLSLIFFYTGIALTFILYNLENNSIYWLIAIGGVLLGILLSLFPDSYINVGYSLKINNVRAIILIKVIELLIVYILTTYLNIKIVLSFSIALALLDIIFSYVCWVEIHRENIIFHEFINRIEQKSKGRKEIFTALTKNIIFMYLLSSISDMNFIIKSFILIVSLVFEQNFLYYLVKKIKILYRNTNNTKMLLLMLWGLYSVICLCVFLTLNKLFLLIFLGLYWMVVSDTVLKKDIRKTIEF
ncbi:hypothetical protein [Anaerosacchariphilus polymeriproducens]|uniref:Uncharacterized protein n=1 Tax=Anaerosacchariphilus polymeriproducens TaxID=1812858 RepID=A0A371ASF6_9FIRM|nr:hypothetical protein [Anaerosacchariphilus polymeriproducens]RDU22501.1 hypothetical protein DWV06_14530 [Anaerosacchariphilus polymeriproducens]